MIITAPNIDQRAKKLARDYFLGKKDDANEDIFEGHLTQVAQILQQVTDDLEIIAAGWLHDIIEDTDYTAHELMRAFGKRVHDLVMEVTHEGQKDSHGYYFPRLETKEGIMIKFADRLSNLSRIKHWPTDRQEQYLRKSKFWRSEGPNAA